MRQLDPQGVELAALREAVDLRRSRVLEPGFGDGRLTFRYARSARLAVGIDLALGSVFQLLGARSADLRERPGLLPACALSLPFRRRAFDLVLLAWSL